MVQSQLSIKRRPQVDDSHLPPHLSATLRQVLARRGIKDTAELELGAGKLLHYSGLADIDTACERLARAIQRNEHICIVGDFDADGATSTALLMLALPVFGAQRLSYLVPNRFNDGYGLTPKLVTAAAQDEVSLIITVDNGIAAHAGVQAAQDNGIDVIVTDHHLPGHTLPTAYAVVNPNRADCVFPSKNLAGVGVAFYLLLALRGYYRKQGSPQAAINVAQWLDLVALGTVADVVPLDHTNRILVQQGLARIKAGLCRPGIRALLETSGRDASRLQASDLGFTVAPRINAAGRLDDIQLGIECLISEDPIKVQALAQQLDALNRERRTTEQSMQQDAQQFLSALQFSSAQMPSVVTLHRENWHQGIIGILAGRVKEQLYRPVIAFASGDSDTLKGSARSVPGVHMRDMLERVYTLAPETISAFGGHAMAAGLSVPRSQFENFQQVLHEVSEQWVDETVLQRIVWSDGELSADELDLSFAEKLLQAGPWGQGFAEPIFDGVFRVAQQRIVGDKHLKLVLQPELGAMTLDAIAFNVDTALWPNHQCQRVHIAYKLQPNEFRGRVSLQLLIDHIESI